MGVLDEGPGAVVGSIFANKYRVERELADGGQGLVVLARHLRLPQLVAIKVPRRMERLSKEARARMLREARAAFRIRSEHVAKVLDVDVQGEMPFIVMEYLPGEDLARVLKSGLSLPINQTVGWVIQVCEALAEAHQLGIVHRDIKPSNIFLCSRREGRPIVKVLDFGLAKAVENVSDDGSYRYSTEVMRIMGSARYMSPEQATGSPTIDHRTDIWSIGAVLYELLAGVAAFAAPTRSESLARILAHDPPPLVGSRPEVSAELEAAVSRCLRKVSDERFPSIHDLVEALAPHAPPWAAPNIARVRSTRTQVNTPLLSPSGDPVFLRSYPSQVTTLMSRPPSRSRLVGPVALLLAATALLVIGVTMRRRTSAGLAPASVASTAPPLSPSPSPSPSPRGAGRRYRSMSTATSPVVVDGLPKTPVETSSSAPADIAASARPASTPTRSFSMRGRVRRGGAPAGGAPPARRETGKALQADTGGNSAPGPALLPLDPLEGRR